MESDINVFWDILKITLPALIVFLTAYFLFRDMLKNSQKQRELEFRIQNQGKITPVRLQAYERLTLFLERISPQSILTRVSAKDTTAKIYHIELLKQIRQEYEHNLSQQIYVLPTTWESIRGSKEFLTGLINKAFEETPPQSPALDLSKKIIEKYIEIEKSPINIALNEIKRETRHMF
jgi:hypothetical protein